MTDIAIGSQRGRMKRLNELVLGLQQIQRERAALETMASLPGVGKTGLKVIDSANRLHIDQAIFTETRTAHAGRPRDGPDGPSEPKTP